MSEPDTGTEAVQTNDAAIVADSIGNTENTENTEQNTNTPQIDAEPSEWLLAEGIPGQGERPEFFKGDKYKTVAEQAKAYKELEGRFGAFTGSPEEYTIPELSEDIKNQGVEIDPDDPLIGKAMEFAKANHMNQEGFNNMVDLYAQTQIAEQMALDDLQQEEFKALGHNAETRLSNLNSWANKNMPTELFENFQKLATSADAVQTLERLVAMTRSAPINPNELTPAAGITAEEVNELRFAKDEHGNRRMRDPSYAKMVKEKSDTLYGTENHVEVIGN